MGAGWEVCSSFSFSIEIISPIYPQNAVRTGGYKNYREGQYTFRDASYITQ